MNEEDSSNNNKQHISENGNCKKANPNDVVFKNVTVLLADPKMDNYWQWWIPQDDIDMDELKDNFSKMPGVNSVTYYDQHDRIIKDWLENPPEFVINQCDEGYKNDEDMESHLTALMDMLGIPYTGPGPDGLCAVKDKSTVRGQATSVGVPVPIEIFIDADEDIASKVPDDMVYPAFAKLANASGSMGVLQSSVAQNKEQAIQGLQELRQQHPTRPLLLQEYLTGREFSIGMAGNPELGDFEVFDPVEVDYSSLDRSKYAAIQLEEFKRDGNSEFWQQVKEVRAKLTPKQMKDIKEYARRMFIRTHCKDFARMDFRMDSKEQIKILDVNPNCWLGGKYRMMAEWAGYSWPDVLSKIVGSAQKRFLKAQRKKAEMRAFEEKRLQEHMQHLGLQAAASPR